MYYEWPDPPPQPADTTAWRIDVRLAVLRWTRMHMGAALAVATGRHTPIGDSTIRGWLQHRPGSIERRIEAIAGVLGVPLAALRPGGPVEPLFRRLDHAAKLKWPRRESA